MKINVAWNISLLEYHFIFFHRNSMLDILFCYAKEEPNIGYRQGMHELLAPILFVLHAESRDNVQNDESLR